MTLGSGAVILLPVGLPLSSIRTMLLESYLGMENIARSFCCRFVHLLRNSMLLFILNPDNDPLLHLTKYGHQDSISQLTVATVSLLRVLLSVDMNHPETKVIKFRTFPSSASYLGGLPSAMAFLPRAELSTTFILVVFITPQVCQICWALCL